MYDYTLLKQKLVEKRMTQGQAGALIGLSKALMSLKISGERDFKQSEILALCKALDIPHRKIDAYFFALEPQGK